MAATSEVAEAVAVGAVEDAATKYFTKVRETRICRRTSTCIAAEATTEAEEAAEEVIEELRQLLSFPLRLKHRNHTSMRLLK